MGEGPRRAKPASDFDETVKSSNHLHRLWQPYRKELASFNRNLVASALHVQPQDIPVLVPVRLCSETKRFVHMNVVERTTRAMLSNAETSAYHRTLKFQLAIASSCSSVQQGVVDIVAYSAKIYPLWLHPEVSIKLVFDALAEQNGFIKEHELRAMLETLFTEPANLLLDLASSPRRYGLQTSALSSEDIDLTRIALAKILDVSKVPIIIDQIRKRKASKHHRRTSSCFDCDEESSSETFSNFGDEQESQLSPPQECNLSPQEPQMSPQTDVFTLDDIKSCYLLNRRLSLIAVNAWTL